MSERMQKILKENAEFEKKSPYNFCDRWCERCLHEKQACCRLYQDEFEQKRTCIAHGRKPGDPEVIAEVLEKQLEGVQESLAKYAEENEIDLEVLDGPEFEKIKEHIKFVENNKHQIQDKNVTNALMTIHCENYYPNIYIFRYFSNQ